MNSIVLPLPFHWPTYRDANCRRSWHVVHVRCACDGRNKTRNADRTYCIASRRRITGRRRPTLSTWTSDARRRCVRARDRFGCARFSCMLRTRLPSERKNISAKECQKWKSTTFFYPKKRKKTHRESTTKARRPFSLLRLYKWWKILTANIKQFACCFFEISLKTRQNLPAKPADRPEHFLLFLSNL